MMEKEADPLATWLVLRDQYEINTSSLSNELTRLFRMLADMRDLIKRYT